MGDWSSYVLAGPKRRGFCPACGARRMAETAAHLIEQVIPHVPVRQWVVSFPIPLRHLFATQPQLLSPVLQVIPESKWGQTRLKRSLQQNRAATSHLIESDPI